MADSIRRDGCDHTSVSSTVACPCPSTEVVRAGFRNSGAPSSRCATGDSARLIRALRSLPAGCRYYVVLIPHRFDLSSIGISCVGLGIVQVRLGETIMCYIACPEEVQRAQYVSSLIPELEAIDI